MAREYTPKEKKKLEANPYTYKVTKNRLFFTADFKREFWTSYQAGKAPRAIMEELGYDLSLFGQKQIDNIVQRIKSQAEAGEFREGTGYRGRRNAKQENGAAKKITATDENVTRLWNELQYLRQEVAFIKKVRPAANGKVTN